MFEKPLDHRWTLRKLAHEQAGSPPGKGWCFDEHELVNAYTREVLRRPEWEWAELDDQRVVWADGGRLFASALSTLERLDPELLFDANDMVFEPIAAPY